MTIGDKLYLLLKALAICRGDCAKAWRLYREWLKDIQWNTEL